MAFVPGFDNDLFISYAHTDNTRRADTDPRGWIEDLHEVLRQRLAKRLGREEFFTIWWDHHRLSGYDHINPTIAAAVRRSALFLCVLSPAYVASPYCLEELELFRESSPPGSDLRCRILTVRHLPVPRDQEPVLLQEVNGYPFFRLDDKKRARELWRTSQNAVNEAYFSLAQDLADDIVDLLARMKDQQPQRPTSPPQSLPTVYLAEVADGLADTRLQLKRSLKQQGIRILPDNPLPSGPALTEEIRKHLAEAHLAVHLVGTEFGDRAFGDPGSRSLAHVQYLQAKDLARRRIVWLSPDLPGARVEDERQQQFLDFLEGEHDPEARVDLLSGVGIEALIDEIVKKVGPATEKRGSRPPPQIDITCQQPDYAAALDIKNHAYRNHFNVNVSVDNGPPFSTRYKEILKRSDALLILYGQASADWVAERANEAQKAVVRRSRSKKGPFVALVYDGPPPLKHDLPFGYQEVAVLTGRDQVARDRILTTIKSHLGV